MKKVILFLFFPMVIFGQTQIGDDIDGEAMDDQSGGSVSLSSDGSIVAIGARFNNGNGDNSGHVRVYENVGGVWMQIGDDIDGEVEGDRSGEKGSVSLSSDGSIVAIGAPSNDGNGNESGHVRVYENIGGVWTQIGDDIDSEGPGDRSGGNISLSSDGSIVAIGARFNNGNGDNSGHVRVYENVGGVWMQIGDDIDGEGIDDRSGWSISLSSDGSIVAISAILNNGNGNDSGHVRVYENVGGVWMQIGDNINGEAMDDLSGWSISLSSDGSIVAIGAPSNDGNGNDSGHVRVYENVGGVWMQIGDDIDGEAMDDLFGISVSLSSNGSVVAIGATNNNGNGNGSGHVRIYQNINGIWTQIGEDIDGETLEDFSGISVSLSSDGSEVAIGARGNDGNGDNSGHVRIYDLSEVIVLSIDASSLNDAIIVYPNPASKTMIVRLDNNTHVEEITIYNSLGQLVQTENDVTIDISGLNAGIYYIKIATDIGTTTKKLIVE